MKKILIWTFVVGIVLGAAVAVWGVISFKGNAVVAERELFVGRDSSYEQLMDSLKPSLKHHLAFDLYAERLGLEESYKVGHYVVKDGMNVIEVVRMLKLGLQTPVNVTMNNVKIPAQLAGKLAPQLEADSVELVEVFTDEALAKELGFDSPLTMFSIFLPNTYEFYWTVKPREFVDRMYREYKRFWEGDRDKKRERSGLDRVEVATLASIVYEETRKVDEMPRVAGVYMNRLRTGMPLQADPTIKYAMQDFGLRRILNRHLKTPSPYNTYLNRGLPPSPICMPSVEAIDAVLNFEKHDYLFFCARPTFDGYHNFAKTYSEHLRNARAYQAELNKRNIKK
ncbi:MAG: endolytic transglycosylase MltG [Alistipes sp.]|nr:endolytic transglycosylase MltG [Alistipes sp.]MBR7115575.1 endolytic transglycosylase MltG [Alistipes sp.]